MRPPVARFCICAEVVHRSETIQPAKPINARIGKMTSSNMRCLTDMALLLVAAHKNS